MSNETNAREIGDQTSAGQLQRIFLLVAVTIVSSVFLWMIRDFLVTLLVAALAAGMTRPVYLWLAERLGGRDLLAAALVILLVFLLVVGPAIALIGLVVGQAIQVSQAITPWVQDQIAHPEQMTGLFHDIPILSRLPIDHVTPDREHLLQSVDDAVKGVGGILVEGAAAAGRTTATFLLQLFIMLYAMFFFLADGPNILDRILYYAPLDAASEDRLLERFNSVTRATLKGSILIGGLQGLLAGLSFWAAGIHGAAFWGTIMMVLSVIPGVGAPLIWVPAVLWLFGSGQTVAAIAVAAWCASVVGSIDNLLRPRLVGGDAKMSDLMILLSTLGGITFFGALGFVLGPILAAVFVTIWDLYGEAFERVLPPTRMAIEDGNES